MRSEAGPARAMRRILLILGMLAVVAVGTPESDEFPLLADRPLIEQLPTAYVCRNFTCDAPTTDGERLRAALSS